jgi:hypothetical protein
MTAEHESLSLARRASATRLSDLPRFLPAQAGGKVKNTRRTRPQTAADGARRGFLTAAPADTARGGKMPLAQISRPSAQRHFRIASAPLTAQKEVLNLLVQRSRSV